MAFASAPFVALAIAASLLVGPPTGTAVDAPPSESESESESKIESEPAGDDARSTAKRAFDDGLAAVAAGEFEAAVDDFERAYSLRPHPVTLFNLALALEKAGRLPEAWEVFDDVIDIVESNTERREIRRHMRAIESEIAIIEIDANPRERLCIDGLDMPRGEVSDYRLAVEPGVHELLLDDRSFRLAFEPGDRRVVLLEGAEELLGGRRRGRLMPAMIGTSIGFGAAAVGLGVSAATLRDAELRTGLAAGAAAGAGVAVVAGVIALLVETRKVRDPSARKLDESATDRCPGSPQLEQRLDIKLAPTIGRPVEFAAAPMQTTTTTTTTMPSMPVPRDAAFPRPRGIQPPRGRI